LKMDQGVTGANTESLGHGYYVPQWCDVGAMGWLVYDYEILPWVEECEDEAMQDC
jgi:hypothetical protein